MLIFDQENWPKHRPWALTALLVTLAAIVWYGFYGLSAHDGQWHWPGGSSPPGFTFGVLGGLIIVFEMLLIPRKYLWRGRRLGRTKYWMMAHLWLGIVVLFLLLLHGDFHFSLVRSTLAAVLMWLLVAVFISGICGAVIQTILPRMILERVPAETIFSQIDHIVDQYREEADRLVKLTCGEGTSARPGEDVYKDAPAQQFQVVGTMRMVGSLQGKVLQTETVATRVPGCEPLSAFFDRYVKPYLSTRGRRGLALASPRTASALFDGLRRRLPREADSIVDRLADLCDQKRQLDLQSSLHFCLFGWLAVHLALSSALLVLMFAHVFLALRFY